MVAFDFPHEDQLEISADFLLQGRRQLAKFKVKNTFIDVTDSDDDSEDADIRLPMVGCKTCPGTLGAETASLDVQLINTEANYLEEEPQPAVAEAQVVVEAEAESKTLGPCLLLQQSRRNFKVKNTFIDGVESDGEDDEDRPPMVATKSLPQRACAGVWPPTPVQAPLEADIKLAEIGSATKATAFPVIVPFDQRQPEHSKGGQLHGTGQCKPCAWFWRPQGCDNGADCGHCHLCTAAELKVRKKAKKHTQKQKAPGSESPESCFENDSPTRCMPTVTFVQWPLAPGIV